MNYIIIIICSIILPIISLQKIKPKLCINCKYFITDNGNGEFGKCSLFPKKQGKIDFLVNGLNKEDYIHCSIVREYPDMCGEEGKMYKKKYTKSDLLN